jgi:tetratricopeptide (TPR) repeat protein
MAERPTETVDGAEFAGFSVQLAPGSIVAGRYAIVSLIGGGGSSLVYHAVDRLLGNDVALKILRSDRATGNALARMRREVALARKIQSPHVVRIHDIGETGDGTAFLTMEIVEGETLAALLARRTIPIDDVVRIATEILQGFEAIHSLGIVHRDIKPSNILIERDGRVKIGDLGLARQFDTSEPKLTRTEVLVGTLHYLSPEQALGLQPDARSDLYSLGATLFECLTGQMPFERDTAIGTLASHISEKAPSVRTLRHDVPRWLDALIARLLAKEPSHRFANARAVLTSIERKRVPIRIRVPFILSLVLGAVTVAALAILYLTKPGACAAIVPTDHGIRAIDARGNSLWSMDGVIADHAVLLNAGKANAVVVVVPGSEITLGTAERSKLILLDPASGRSIATVRLATAAQHFADASTQYSAVLRPVDTNHDRYQELLISFANTYWPWYAVIFDSKNRQASLLYVSTGHNIAQTSADVDGDGFDEIVFAGVDNLLGWYAAIAAVRVPRDEAGGVLQRSPACSPAVSSFQCSEQNLAWFTLLQRGWIDDLTADPSRGLIHARYRTGEDIDLILSGHVAGTASARSAPSLDLSRRRAHELLAAARRDEADSRWGDAIAQTRLAHASAVSAGEPYLAEWCRRFEARLLMHAGDPARADALYKELLKASSSAADIAYDAGRLHFLRGENDKAFEYFHLGLFEDRGPKSGRLKYEFVEGAIFALLADGDVDGALAFIQRARTAAPDFAASQYPYEAAVRWLAGRDFDQPPADGPLIDLGRYWMLEFAWQKERNASALLPRVEREIALEGPMGGTLESLRAEILASLGRRNEAARAIAHAMERAEAEKSTDVNARAHYGVIRRRFEAIAVSAE